MIKRTSELLPLTPALARQLANMDSVPGDRELDQRRVEQLRRQAAVCLLGMFRWSYVSIGTKQMRLNGQHSSFLLVALADEGRFPVGLQVYLRTYQVDGIWGLLLLRLWKSFKHHLYGVACHIREGTVSPPMIPSIVILGVVTITVAMVLCPRSLISALGKGHSKCSI